MATAAINAPSRLDPRVSNPLDQLRGTIRTYVVIEGLLSAAIFLAAWFALGLLVDFGLFKLATWDWVLDAPAWLRTVALVVAFGLLVGIVALRIVARLSKELSYPALALVLERRFPKVLGDRLITAVELADVERQAQYGYSTEMIQITIDEARERVGTVPVNDVFNWKRLRRMAALAVALVVLVGIAGFASYIAATGSASPKHLFWRSAHVSGTFLERNVLLQNTPWPRRVHLEFVGFDDKERRIPKDAPETDVKVKAYRWVVADSSAPMGWRPMVWGDVTESLIGSPVPALPVAVLLAAAEPGELGGDPEAWPVDQVYALGIEDAESRAKLIAALPGTMYESLRNGLDTTFAGLDAAAARPSMGRRLRKLDVPDKVTLVYSGQTKSGDVTLGPLKNQHFASQVGDLKETIHFVVRAEDFRTPSKTIALVPPPMFTELTGTESQPAYLHHTPPQGEGYSALKDLRQQMPKRGLSLTGDRTQIAVPSGTELELNAKVDTDLIAAYLQPKVGVLPGAKPGSGELVPIPVGADKRSVAIEFRDDYRLAAGHKFDHYFFDSDGTLSVASVTSTPTIEFDLVVEQVDHVMARRQFSIQIVDDQPPVVELAVETIRKVGNVYYVTPKARIPFNPESYIRDDRGLARVAYEFTYWPEDSDIGRALRAQLLARSFLYVPGPIGVASGVAPAYHAFKFRDLDKGDSRKAGSEPVLRFSELQRELVPETRQRLLDILKNPRDEAEAAAIKKLDLRALQFVRDPSNSDRTIPTGDFFDVPALKLQASVSEVQTRFRLDLNVVATDTNVDTGPKTGQNAEAIHILIVSEGDLLAEINKEEETFAARLDEALSKLVGARKKWEFVRSLNSAGRITNNRDDLDTVRVRASDAEQDVGKARDVVQSVVREYRRIHKECIVNDVTEVTRDGFGKFANRIDRVAGESPPPVTKEEAGQVQAGLLQPKMTFPEVEKRIASVLASLSASAWADVILVNDTESALAVLEFEVRTIRNELGERQSKERLKAMLTTVIERQERLRKELENWKIESSGDQLKKEPKLIAIGPVFLTKGETRKLKHAINWRQFDKDDLTLKFTVLDKDKKPVPADVLGVAATLKLNFEKNQTDFEYDVKGGAKEGEYAITIAPEVGDPIDVIVTVK